MNHISKRASSLNNVKLFNEWVILLFITIALFLASCNPEPMQLASPVQTLPVITVNESTEQTFVEYPASIQGSTDLEIRPQIAGTIDKIYVNEGQLVNKGQLLFKISELPFRAQLNNAVAAVNAAKAAALNAQLEVDKLTPLVQAKVVSAFQLQTAKTAHQIALANLEQAKASVNSAQINLNYTQIKAPISGYIGRLPKKQGSLVSPADIAALTELSDVHNVHVYFSLAETDFINFNSKYEGKSTADQMEHLPPVSLVLADKTVYPSKGKIDMINGQFDKTTGAITLRASFANTNGQLRSGNTGKVRLGLAHHHILLVPQASTIEIQDKVFVFAVGKDNKISKLPIKVLGTSGVNYLVEDGLKSGDQIVSKGFESLKEGDSIQPEKAKTVTAYNASNK
jgi:membrane fusion protein (multidrug efflux system)